MALKTSNLKYLVIVIVVTMLIAFFLFYNQFSMLEEMRNCKSDTSRCLELANQYFRFGIIIDFIIWIDAISLTIILYKSGLSVFMLIAGVLLLMLGTSYPFTIGNLLYKAEQYKAMWMLSFLSKLANPIALLFILGAITNFAKKTKKAGSPENISDFNNISQNLPHDPNREDSATPKKEDYILINSVVFNLAFIIFSAGSFALFLLGTGGWTAMIEFILFALAFVILLLWGIIRLIVNFFKKKKYVIVRKKTAVTFIIVIALLAIYITIFNVGDCGDVSGSYNLIKKVIMGNNACQESYLDRTMMGSTFLFLAIPAYLIILFIFSWFVNSRVKAAEENLSLISPKGTNIFSAAVIIILFILILLAYFALGWGNNLRKLSQAASKNTDITICDKINPSGDWEKIEKGTCYMNVISKIYKEKGADYLQSNCEKITDPNYRSDCITFAAGLFLKNISFCDSLIHTEIAERCKTSVARYPEIPFE